MATPMVIRMWESHPFLSDVWALATLLRKFRVQIIMYMHVLFIFILINVLIFILINVIFIHITVEKSSSTSVRDCNVCLQKVVRQILLQNREIVLEDCDTYV